MEQDINKLVKQMEEMANASKEPMGTRTPGELGSYEKAYRRELGMGAELPESV